MQLEPKPARPPAKAQSPSLSPAASKAATVLVVEDDDASARALSLLLAHSGWKVSIAPTLAAANAWLDRHAPDSIILDLMLPDGDGATILERVRRELPAVKVTVTTASCDSRHLNRVRRLNPDAMLKKPIDVAELLRVL